MFSNACEYGIKAVIFLASQAKSEKQSNVAEISKAIDSPRPFTAKVLQLLVKASIIKSVMGAKGGFLIEKKRLSKISILDVVLAIDGERIINDCVLGLKHCSEINPCPMHNKYKVVRNDIVKMLQLSLVSNLADELVQKVFVLRH